MNQTILSEVSLNCWAKLILAPGRDIVINNYFVLKMGIYAHRLCYNVQILFSLETRVSRRFSITRIKNILTKILIILKNIYSLDYEDILSYKQIYEI